VSPCKVYYQGRYEPVDPPIRLGVMYTGFLIVRVESDSSLERYGCSLGAFMTLCYTPTRRKLRIMRRLSIAHQRMSSHE
jgi:hypothetical protein